MAAYLIDNPPAVQQWYAKRNRPLTGCTVLHSAEGVLDTIGPDTGAEVTADFIRRRTTAGSYHDLVDSDSWVPLVPYEYGAFHDGTGSNNWALSISFACRTTDWRAMTAERRAGFMAQGARAFAAQQAWRKANGFPLTELRLITKAQSDAGMSGFTYHGYRDPSRRTDPGSTPAAPFPIDEWLAAAGRAVLSAVDAATPEEDTMKTKAFRSDPSQGGTGAIALAMPGLWWLVPDPAYWAMMKAHGITEDYLNLPPNVFDFYRAFYTLTEVNDNDIKAAVEKLSVAEAARASAVS